jgi:hypothetical protein
MVKYWDVVSSHSYLKKLIQISADIYNNLQKIKI